MASYSSPFLWRLVKIGPEITKLWQYLFSEFLNKNGSMTLKNKSRSTKTSVPGLLCGVVWLVLRLAITIYWRVRDTQAHTQRHWQTHDDSTYPASIASHGKNGFIYQLGTHTLHGSRTACFDSEVKTSKVKVTVTKTVNVAWLPAKQAMCCCCCCWRGTASHMTALWTFTR